MKHSLLLSLLFIVAITVGCQKDDVDQNPAEPPILDTKNIRLNEVIEPGLPTPYFKFSYNAAGYISDINFADGLFIYSLAYQNGRITKMVNTRLHDVLTYYYSAGSVSYI